MKAVLASFGIAFSALLPLINPLGSALVFLSIVGPASPDTYRRLARRVAVNTMWFLLLIETGGLAIMRFFGISLPVMQVSGGLVLAAMGWGLLSKEQPAPETASTAAAADPASLDTKLFYPLTFPLTAGPGTIVVMITLSARAPVARSMVDLATHGGIALAIAAVSATVFICYGFAPRIAGRIKPQTAHGIQRVIAFLLLSIGVQITWNGLSALLKTLPR